jgi:hypothetical protein
MCTTASPGTSLSTCCCGTLIASACPQVWIIKLRSLQHTARIVLHSFKEHRRGYHNMHQRATMIPNTCSTIIRKDDQTKLNVSSI